MSQKALKLCQVQLGSHARSLKLTYDNHLKFFKNDDRGFTIQ